MTRRRLLAALSATLAALSVPFAWLWKEQPKRVLRAELITLVDAFGGRHRVHPWRTPVKPTGFRDQVETCPQGGHPLAGQESTRWEATLDLDAIAKGRELVLMPQWKDGSTEVWCNHIRPDCRKVTLVDWTEALFPQGFPEVVWVYEVV